MSLVISAWDKHAGVAVCEGRVGAWVGGKYVPTEENHSKLSRLPNGGLLGIAGHSREGFSTYASLTDVCAEQLRPAIVQAAETHGFCELSRLIPALLADCNRAHPELFFCVSLLGTDNGTVSGGAWDSDGKVSVPTATDGLTWLILSPSEEFSGVVDAALREGLQDSAPTSEVIQNIIRTLAVCQPDINDHTYVEAISARPFVSMNASNITSGTLSANKVLFGDGTALTTASRVSTLKATPSASIPVAGQNVVIPGFTWNVNTASANDVYNISGMLLASLQNGVLADPLHVVIAVDGNTSSPCLDVPMYFLTQNAQHNFPFFSSISGLSAGAHTIQVYCSYGGPNFANVLTASFGICQRTF